LRHLPKAQPQPLVKGSDVSSCYLPLVMVLVPLSQI
jgi:hypothetical protein